MTFTIRLIRPADNASVATVIRQTFIEHNAPQAGTVYTDPTTDDLCRYFQQTGAIGYVAVEEGEVMGSCGIYPTSGLPEGCVEIVKFYLKPEARGRGIGRALMEECLRAAGLMGYNKLYLESLPHFDKAVKMYEKLGFRRIDKPLGQSGHGGCNVWMMKEM